MNNLLDLAQTFQKTSEEELANTSKIVKNAIKQQENDLIKQLQDANERIEQTIQDERQKLIRKTLMLYRFPMILIFILLLILTIGAITLAWYSKMTYQDMEKWKTAAQLYKENAHHLKLAKCTNNGKKSLICIEMDPQYLNKIWQTPKNPYQIVKIEK